MALSLEERLRQGPLLCDGAMGTQLYARGVGTKPLARANLTHPDVVKAVHLDYLQAGAEVIQTNTFGANVSVLGETGHADKVAEINRRGVVLALEARSLSGQPVWVAGALGPLGKHGVTLGALDSAADQNIFAQQASALAEAGVDLFMLETFGSLAELKLAVGAVRSVSPLPIVAELTFTAEAVSLAGDTPEEIAEGLAELDVAAFGANCSVGPDVIRRGLERMAAIAHVPRVAQPNAGLPTYVDGKLEYTAGPDYFADTARQTALAGAVLVGGCCGTTPEYIAKVRDSLRGVEVPTERRPAPVPRKEPAAQARPRPAPLSTALSERLARGEFVVTTELSPPRGFDITATLEKLRGVLGHVHAVNVTDSPRAQGRMSALATCSLVQSKIGVETIMHMAIRHRNLLALHSDLLGAHALGVRHVFTVMGDVPLTGDYPQATAVGDITTSGMIRLISGFNDGVDGNGRPIEEPTSFFIGGALNLGAADLDRELRVLERKVEAGAHFLLTQPVYDPEAVERTADRLGGFPLPVLLGVLPLRSVRHARFLHNEVPGISVPDAVFERLERAGDDVAAEGIAISRELLEAVHGRIAGVYFIPPFGRYQIVSEVLEGLDIPGLA